MDLKTGKITWILLFTGIAAIFAGVFLGKAVISSLETFGGAYGMGRITVTVKNHIDTQETYAFTLEEVEQLKKQLKTEEITYRSQSGADAVKLEYGSKSYSAAVDGTNHQFSSFHRFQFKDGGFIPRKAEEEKDLVAVIGSDTAWELFKTINVVGMRFEMFDRPFTIIGVYTEGDSVLHKLTDAGKGKVYIPAKVLAELDPKAKITTLHIRTKDTSTLGRNKALVSNALQAIGKKPDNYVVIDYNLRKALMEQKPELLVFLMGLVSILLLLGYLKRRAEVLCSELAVGCRTNYLSIVLKENALQAGGFAVKTVAVLAAVFLLWSGIAFKLYIPSRYIPEMLIDVSYFTRLFESDIRESVANVGYMPSAMEMMLNTADQLVSRLFYVGLAGGVILLLGGFYPLRLQKTDPSTASLLCGAFLLLSLGAVAVGAFSVGLAPAFDLKSVGVIWVFIGLGVLWSGREGGVPNG